MATRNGMSSRSKKPPALRSRITSALRNVWRFSPEAKEALEHARVVLQARPRRVGFRCALCGVVEKRENVHVDHIEPVVGTEGFQGWDVYVERLFCASTGLRVLCHACHEDVTKEQREERKATKVKKK